MKKHEGLSRAQIEDRVGFILFVLGIIILYTIVGVAFYQDFQELNNNPVSN